MNMLLHILLSPYIISVSYTHLDVYKRQERSGLLKTALDNSLFTSGTTVSDEDRLLTLSTCSYEYDNARFVLMLSLIHIWNNSMTIAMDSDRTDVHSKQSLQHSI